MDAVDEFIFLIPLFSSCRELGQLAYYLMRKGRARGNRDTGCRIPRVQGYVDICRRMRADTFKGHFRFDPSSVEVIFQNIATTFLVRHTNLMKERGVLLSLWYLANQEGFRQIADRFGLSLSAAHRTVAEFCKAINHFRAYKITWPSNNEIAIAVEGFNQLREISFPGVVGAIDGCHIHILAPWKYRTRMPHLDRSSYINRKQVASVLLQGIANSNLEFLNVFAGWPGSSHDARVFRRSQIGQALMKPGFLPPDVHVIGDCAYPLLESLMTPYKDTGHLTEQQRYFNTKLSSSRIVIEQAFGKLMGRFRRLRILDIYNKNLAALYITTCCTLHNLCQRLGDDVAEDYFDGGPEPQSIRGNTPSGTHKRDAIARRLFENRDSQIRI